MYMHVYHFLFFSAVALGSVLVVLTENAKHSVLHH